MIDAIQCDLADSNKGLAPGLWKAAAEVTKHTINTDYEHSPTITCAVCKAYCDKGNNSTLIAWLKSNCDAPVLEEPGAPVSVANSFAHHSHHLQRFEAETWGVWWCVNCGKYAQHVMKALSKECSGKKGQAGKQNIARLEIGLMPGSSAAAKAYNKTCQSYRCKPRKGKP